MRVKYTYNSYKNCPEATEISRQRSKAFVVLCMAWAPCFIVSLLCSFIDSPERILSIIIAAVVCPLWLVYLIFGYNKVTDRKIKEALGSNIDIEQIKSNFSAKYKK